MTGIGFVEDLTADSLDHIEQAILARASSLDLRPVRIVRLYLGCEGLSLVPEPA